MQTGFERRAEQRDSLRNIFPEFPDLSHRWDSFINRLGIPEVRDRLNARFPGIYFSPEYGLKNLVANGGLGFLSRDHYQTAVDLGVPGIFLGLAYSAKKHQAIEHSGAGFRQIDPKEDLPTPETYGMRKVDTLKISVTGSKGTSSIQVWEYPQGTRDTHLLLLQVPGEVYPKSPHSDSRLWNCAVLGFGGHQVIKQLREQGVYEEPAYYHLNESSTVLGVLATLDELTEQYGNTPEAYERALGELRAKTILTNHTLVPAAEASYDWRQCNEFIFSNLKSEEVKKQLTNLIHDRGEKLVFLDLSFYLAGRYNGVSALHAQKAAEIFHKHYGANYYGNDIEFADVTNGIFMHGWNPTMVEHLEKYGIIDEFDLPIENEEAFHQKIDALSTQELVGLKNDAVESFRQYLEAGEHRDQFGEIVHLPEHAIIAGDARRVAGYKRRWMMFKHPEELKKILDEHPDLHIFISGKAHPEDGVSKDELSYIMNTIAGDALFRERIHYMPGWDAEFAQSMGPACHIWLNNPRVGEEACGTSGMKTGLGGALQVSTEDGFYAELDPQSYYRIEGPTDSEEEYASYYSQLTSAVRASESPDLWVMAVKTMWKGGILRIASGSRMVGQYTWFGLE